MIEVSFAHGHRVTADGKWIPAVNYREIPK